MRSTSRRSARPRRSGSPRCGSTTAWPRATSDPDVHRSGEHAAGRKTGRFAFGADWYGGYAYAGPYPYRTYGYGYAAPDVYGGAYAYAGEPYYGRRYGPRYRYRYAPATSDYFHNSRQLQGTR